MTETLSVIPQRRYFEKPEDQLSVIMDAGSGLPLPGNHQSLQPLVHHLSPALSRNSNRKKDISWELFTRGIIDQFPKIQRVVLHGVGEPMLVKELPQHDPLFEGSRRLRALQYQRNPV